MKIKVLILFLCLTFVAKSIEAQVFKVHLLGQKEFDSMLQEDSCFSLYSRNMDWHFAVISPFLAKGEKHFCNIIDTSLSDSILIPANIYIRAVDVENSIYLIVDSVWVSENFMPVINIPQDTINNIVNHFVKSLNFVSISEPGIKMKREQLCFPIFSSPFTEF